MNWRRVPRREIAAMVLMAAFIVAILFVQARFSDPGRPNKSNSGFGPDWNCTNPGRGGEPICIRVRPASTKD
jgi:hypothetical protein